MCPMVSKLEKIINEIKEYYEFPEEKEILPTPFRAYIVNAVTRKMFVSPTNISEKDKKALEKEALEKGLSPQVLLFEASAEKIAKDIHSKFRESISALESPESKPNVWNLLPYLDGEPEEKAKTFFDKVFLTAFEKTESENPIEDMHNHINEAVEKVLEELFLQKIKEEFLSDEMREKLSNMQKFAKKSVVEEYMNALSKRLNSLFKSDVLSKFLSIGKAPPRDAAFELHQKIIEKLAKEKISKKDISKIEDIIKGTS